MTSPLFGTWQNTDTASASVVRLAFEPESDRVHAWAAGPEGVVGLGAGPIATYVGLADPTVLAFTARLPGAGAGPVVLQGNLNRGLMILATYFGRGPAGPLNFGRGPAGRAGDSPLAGRFSREFLARRTAEFVPGSADSGLPMTVAGDLDLDLGEFVGHWANASEHGELRSLDIASTATGLEVGVRGSGRRLPAVWPSGDASLFGYHDELGRDTLLLLASFELPEGRSDLQIKVVTGTAVVACFHSRSEGRSWFTREFLGGGPPTRFLVRP